MITICGKTITVSKGDTFDIVCGKIPGRLPCSWLPGRQRHKANLYVVTGAGYAMAGRLVNPYRHLQAKRLGEAGRGSSCKKQRGSRSY